MMKLSDLNTVEKLAHQRRSIDAQLAALHHSKLLRATICAEGHNQQHVELKDDEAARLAEPLRLILIEQRKTIDTKLTELGVTPGDQHAEVVTLKTKNAKRE